MTENEDKIYDKLKKYCKYQRFRKFCYAKYIEDMARGWIVSKNQYHKGYTQEEFYSEVALVFKTEPCFYCYNDCTIGEYAEISSIPMCQKIVDEWMTAYKIGGQKGDRKTHNIMLHYIYQNGWLDYVSDEEIISYTLEHLDMDSKFNLETYLDFKGTKPNLQTVIQILKQAIIQRKIFVAHVDYFGNEIFSVDCEDYFKLHPRNKLSN